MDAEAREYPKEIQADEDAGRRAWANDGGDCVDCESTIDPSDDPPETEIIMATLYDI